MLNQTINRLLKETEKDIARTRTELNDLEALAKMLRRHLPSEILSEPSLNPSHTIPKKPKTPLTDFIVSFLGDSPKTFDEVKQATANANLLVATKHPSQTVNMALAGLKHKGFADNIEGKWRLTDLLGGSEGGKS